MPNVYQKPLSESFQSALLNQLANRLAALSHDPTPQSYAVLIVLTDAPRPQILYSVRAAHLREHAGEVAFAGGRREDDDVSNTATALREAHEEVGILPTAVQVLGELPLAFGKSGRAVKPIVGVIAPNTVLTLQADEISRIFWADLLTLISQPTVPYTYPYGKQVYISPSFSIAGETVWGLTARITASLLKIGFDRDVRWYQRLEPRR